MAFTTVTLTGSYADRANGDPARGYVSFQLSNALINDTVIAPRVKEKAKLTDGAFSITLPATNDTGTTPTGATYEVVEHIDGASENTYSIELVYTDTTQDLADIAPTDAGDATYGVSSTTFQAHLTDETDAHDASAVSVTPAGNISSVNVQDALEELDTEITALDTAPTTGALHVIEEIVVSVDAASVVFDNIPDTYRHLELVASVRTDRVSVTDSLDLTINGDTGGNYAVTDTLAVDETITGVTAGSPLAIGLYAPGGSATAGRFGAIDLKVIDYAGAHHKVLVTSSGFIPNDTEADFRRRAGMGIWKNTAAVSAITITGPNGDIVAGSVLTLYGRT